MKYKQQRYVAFLRGINVGGHHKVPMVALCQAFQELGYVQVKSFLNSGNVVFERESEQKEEFEEEIAEKLEKTFGYSIPVLVRKEDEINELIESDPFKGIPVHKAIRLYISFLKEFPQQNLPLPWISSDGSFQILKFKGLAVCSILDISKSKTTEAMNILEKSYGKNITTRNWNTIEKISVSFKEKNP